MSFIPVFQYLGGIGVFGLLYWLMNGILRDIQSIATEGSALDILLFFWLAILVVYLIFGGIWVSRKYNEQEYRGY